MSSFTAEATVVGLTQIFSAILLRAIGPLFRMVSKMICRFNACISFKSPVFFLMSTPTFHYRNLIHRLHKVSTCILCVSFAVVNVMGMHIQRKNSPLRDCLTWSFFRSSALITPLLVTLIRSLRYGIHNQSICLLASRSTYSPPSPQ